MPVPRKSLVRTTSQLPAVTTEPQAPHYVTPLSPISHSHPFLGYAARNPPLCFPTLAIHSLVTSSENQKRIKKKNDNNIVNSSASCPVRHSLRRLCILMRILVFADSVASGNGTLCTADSSTFTKQASAIFSQNSTHSLLPPANNSESFRNMPKVP